MDVYGRLGDKFLEMTTIFTFSLPMTLTFDLKSVLLVTRSKKLNFLRLSTFE